LGLESFNCLIVEPLIVGKPDGDNGHW